MNNRKVVSVVAAIAVAITAAVFLLSTKKLTGQHEHSPDDKWIATVMAEQRDAADCLLYVEVRSTETSLCRRLTITPSRMLPHRLRGGARLLRWAADSTHVSVVYNGDPLLTVYIPLL